MILARRPAAGSRMTSLAPIAAVRVVARSAGDAWDALLVMALLSLAWIGLCLTVILAAPATEALFEAMHTLAEGRTPDLTDMLRSIRRRFLASWAWGAWSLAGFALFVAQVWFYLGASDATAFVSAAFIVLGALFAVSVLYVWPFVFLDDDGQLVRAVRNAVLSVLAAPLFALSLAFLLVLVIAASAVLVLPLAAFTPAFVCLVASHAVTDRLRAFGKLPPRPVVDAE